VTKSVSLLAVCTIAHGITEGKCAWCGSDLPKRRRTWCSDKCGDAFWANHWWSVARRAAKRRDKYTCKRCGKNAPKRPSRVRFPLESQFKAAMRVYRKARKTERLEVNHIVQARGLHRALSCVHHLDNLETLCSDCHKTHTAALPRPSRKKTA
jgi:hypothetical protein